MNPILLSRRVAAALVLLFVCLRFAHVHLLWADEDYHMAAAIQMLHSKVPYRDFWYDKPPLSAFYYLLIGGYAGWPLRLLDAAYILGACALIYRLAAAWWTDLEGRIAAVLLAFYTAFYLPSAVIPFAADAVMLVPHVAASYCAFRRKPVAAGVLCGIAFFANPKALFVFSVCAAWLLPAFIPLTSAFIVTVGLGGVGLFLAGAWPGYIEQVWRWGFQYAAGSPVVHPLLNGIARTLNWGGFHAALLAAGAVAVSVAGKQDRTRLLLWTGLSFAAVALGSRFAPHYFLQLLPAVVVAAARGVPLAFERHPRCTGLFLAIALAVPLFRFGPRYVTLAADLLRGTAPQWPDVAMDLDSQKAAAFVNRHKQTGDTLLVWGYRPDVYVATRLSSDGLFWDSQPLTGVAADRHLWATTAIYSGPATTNRTALVRTHPTWIVDGLGLLNPKLRPQAYPDLADWLSHYEEVDRTPLSIVYHRKQD